MRWSMRLSPLLLAACASSPAPKPAPPAPTASLAGFGLTKEAAIEVCRPMGQRAYLARLTCPNGRHPRFERIGSVGSRQPIPENLSEADLDRQFEDMLSNRPFRAGDPDDHIVDAYQVVCGTRSTTLYLDMYHCGVPAPKSAPTGFGIAP